MSHIQAVLNHSGVDLQSTLSWKEGQTGLLRFGTLLALVHHRVILTPLTMAA